MKTQNICTKHKAARGPRADYSGTLAARTLLRITLAAALLVCTQAAHADKILVTFNGAPVGQGAQIPKGSTNIKKADTVKVDGQDLYWSAWTFDVPPPPAPQTYRVVQPSGTVMVIGDKSIGTPKQVGGSVVLTYSGGETVEWKGTLLSPGQPDPAPTPALADVEELLQEPGIAYISSTPIDLSYFQYDFYGTADFPIFLGGYSINYTDGTVDSMQIVPEPGSLLLLGSGVLGLSGFLRKRLFI